MPSRARPAGKHRAKYKPPAREAMDAVVTGLVATLRVDVPLPPVTAAGLKAQVGGKATTGVTLQPRVTSALKAFTGAIVIVDMDDDPALTDTGVKAEAVRSKSGTGTALTVRSTVVS